MSKIALITDTTSDLDEEIIRKYNINILPFRIIYKDKEYIDKYEITPKQVYENLSVEVPTSSLPSMKDMEELYCRLEKEGYTHVIAVVLSTGLSGIYNALRIVSESHTNIESFIYDSKSISLGEGIIIEQCAKLIEKGKSFDDIVEQIPVIKSKIKVFFVVGTLEYLKKGGRIGKVSGTIAELLNLKPIISIDEHGVYYTYDKVRGRKQSLKRIVEIGEKITSNIKCKVYIRHSNCFEEAQKVVEAFKELKNVSEVDFGGEISPVSGVHSGPGLVGVIIYEEK